MVFYRGAVVVRLAAPLGALLLTAGCAASGSAAPQRFTVGSTVHAMSFTPRRSAGP
jgi:hypothetical protein